MSAIDQFRAAIEAAGMVPPDHIESDGLLHRFSPTGKRGDSAAWYVLHSDGVDTGVFGCWRTGLQSTWCSKSDHAMTDAERQILRDQVRAAKHQRDAEQLQRQQQAGNAAMLRWQAAAPVTQHPYLTAKQVQAHSLRVGGGLLLVPLRDTAGQLHSLQTIDA